MAIKWETHDENDEWLQSECGTFEVRVDPVYGYLSLRKCDDSTESLAEHMMLPELTRFAEAYLLSNPGEV